MPFAVNSINRLAAAGWNVDVFLWEQPSLNYSELFPSCVRVRYQTASSIGRIAHVQLAAAFLMKLGYACVFALGQIGSFVGAILSTASRCPLVLLNDEFPSAWEVSRWTQLEKWAGNRASAIIVPSAERSEPLAKELGLRPDMPFVEIRNTPVIREPLEKRNWHEVFGIPVERKIFMHAGSLADWAQLPEILMSVGYWPEDAVLLVHSRTTGEQMGYRQQLSHLDFPGRVYWSSTPLSEAMLNSLVAYCHGTFALYRNMGLNIVYIGTSSGKLMRSLVCGCPVIASHYDSLGFVTQQGVGIQVSQPSEIPAAIYELGHSSDAYRRRCLAFASHEPMLAQANWNKLASALRNFVDLNAA
jgi:glycosyltransferase involved in cell wall biosynthesis